MFRYINKNKSIPDFFKHVSEHLDHYQAKINILKMAIEKPEVITSHQKHSEDIFADPEAPLILLYAIENKLIAYWPGITLFIYFVALAQFTNMQALRTEHNTEQNPKLRIKQLRHLVRIELTRCENGVLRLSESGHEYIDNVIYLYKLLEVNINEYSLREFIFSLPPLERSVLVIDNYLDNYGKTDADTMLRNIRENVAFFKSRNNNQFILPSTSLINYFLKQSCDTPMEMSPFVGNIRSTTRHAEHLANKNPVLFYLKEVAQTLLNAHDLQCGPFPILAHDIGHTFWANLLTKAERDIINHELIPFFDSLKLTFNTNAASTLLSVINEYLTDYDLTPILNFAKRNTRLTKYVMLILALEMRKACNMLNEETHAVDILISLNQLVSIKRSQPNAHPFWVSLSRSLVTEFKSFLRPLGEPHSSTDPDSPRPVHRDHFFRINNRTVKRRKTYDDECKSSELGVSTNGFG